MGARWFQRERRAWCVQINSKHQHLWYGSYVLLAAIYHGGRTWIVYSASGCAGTGYKLGRLELTGSDPLNASSWTKYGSPIFQSGNGFVQFTFYVL
jgi:GH43 family beta-xylosidase